LAIWGIPIPYQRFVSLIKDVRHCWHGLANLAGAISTPKVRIFDQGRERSEEQKLAFALSDLSGLSPGQIAQVHISQAFT
jgi:hypothetical protein